MSFLRLFRHLQGKTQVQISQMSGVDQARISRIENCLVHPSDREKKLLAEVLGLKIEDIFDEQTMDQTR